MVLTNIKTPGVYIEEVSLFPPSVAEVATAIPAFIGYTETAVDSDGKSLSFIPTRILSLKEYETYFGVGYTPTEIIVTVNASQVIQSVAPSKRFYLYESMRQYFDNGGGPCYVVSVDTYLKSNGSINDVAIGDESSGLIKGLKQVEKYDEPTLLLFPDAVLAKDGGNLTDYTKIAELQKAALAQCVKLQDRFTIMDLADGDKAEDVTNKPISTFRDKVGVNGLSYGGAYYPWIINSYTYNISYSQLSFPAPADLAAVSKNATETALLDAVKKPSNPDKNSGSLKNLDLVVNTLAAITGLSGTAAEIKAGMKADAASYLSTQLSALKKVITDGVTAGDNAATLKPKNSAYFTTLNSVIHAFMDLESALPSGSLKTDLTNYKKDNSVMQAVKDVLSLEQLNIIISRTTLTVASIRTYFDDMFDSVAANNPWVNLDKTDDLPAGVTAAPNSQDGLVQVITQIETDLLSKILNALGSMVTATNYYIKITEDALFSQHSFFKAVKEQATRSLRTMPVSGAVAGVYAMTDSTRGVWKAPANVSLNAVVGPSVKIDNKDQEDLNVHSTGKSINAIRSFTGKGTLVWGGRTLTGNDNEWRYVSVRRFFIMVEESTKKATAPFVFESNDANTWTKVKAMISNFLTLQWRAGALQGAKPDHAFYVKVGLGETMSQDEILNGRMIVEIGMAVVRPAEFIILRFSHKMIES